MFQIDVQVERSALPSQSVYPQPGYALRDAVTATIIREEAAEGLLPSIQNDAELQALNEVLNRYPASWWLQHLSRVGADPAGYWREQLEDEIKAAAKGKTTASHRKKFAWWFLCRPVAGVTYDLSLLDLIPLCMREA